MISTEDRVSMISTQDRLSNLPDSILSHILSFLPTKLAARTSILSKMWKPIWRSVTTLDFTVGITPNHIIYSLILSRDIKLPIPSFRLRCYNPDDFEDLDSVIKAAIQRRVETLELILLSDHLEMKFFSNIFTSNTLTVLKLTHICIVKDLPGISVSSIKTLHLDDVIFSRSSYVINFFSAFPILEELQTNNISVYDLTQPAPGPECLPNLVRANIHGPTLIPLLSFSRALILNLEEIWKLRWVQVPNFYNLTQMELFLDLDQLGKWILKLLQHTPKLEHLIIHHEEIEREEVTDEMNRVDTEMVPECLSSRLKTCLFGSWRGKKCELQFAEYIMRNSKVLSTMTIQCSSSLDLNAKYQILQKLSLCPKSSKLIFD